MEEQGQPFRPAAICYLIDITHFSGTKIDCCPLVSVPVYPLIMVHTAAGIANRFLQKAEMDRVPLTLMQLIKLIYFAHGWSLAYLGRPLIDENFQAWQFGPVLNSIYQAAKKYGSNPVTQHLPGYFSDTYASASLEPDEEKLIEAVWGHYGKKDAFELSKLTHVKGSPWDQVWHVEGGKSRRSAQISNEKIAEYFKKFVKKTNG